MKQPGFAQKEFPIVVVHGFPAGNASQQHEFEVAGVVDIGGQIHQTLTQPPEGYRGPYLSAVPADPYSQEPYQIEEGRLVGPGDVDLYTS